MYCRFTEECVEQGWYLPLNLCSRPCPSAADAQPPPPKKPSPERASHSPLAPSVSPSAPSSASGAPVPPSPGRFPLRSAGTLLGSPLDGRLPEARAAALPAWAGSALHAESDTGRGPCSTCSPNSVSALLPLRVMTFGPALNTL